jgi:class 3 adenylate cyclase
MDDADDEPEGTVSAQTWPSDDHPLPSVEAGALPSGTVSFLLTDIVGSTRKWEEHPHEMDLAVLTHDRIIETAVSRAGGLLLKARGEGDSTFSVFSRASDALTAATEAQRSLQGDVWPPGLSLTVRMGLNTGEAVERDGDYFGSAVSRAARLRSLATGGQILLSRAMATVLGYRVPAGWELSDLGEQTLAGFDRPEQVYGVFHEGLIGPAEIGIAGATAPPRPRVGPLMAAARRPVINRELEQAALRTWVSDLCRGQARAVLVSGAAGIGKSILSAACCWLAERRGARVLIGRCHQDVAIPYLPWATALQGLSGEETTSTVGSDLAPLLGLLEAEPTSRPELALYTGLARTLLAAARSRPTLVLLEDLHWADKPSLNLLGHALAALSTEAALRPTRLMFVLTYRTPVLDDRVGEVLARFHSEPVSVDLAVGGLEALALNELLAEHGPFPPSPALLADIADASAGNPFLAESLLRRLWRGGQLGESGGRLVALDHREEVVPRQADLQWELRARVDAVSEACQQALAIASVLGDGQLLSDLAAVIPLEPDGVEMLLEEAATAELASVSGDRYRFEHPLIRAACSTKLRGRARRQLHLRIARHLIERQGERVAELAPRIADHLVRSGQDSPTELMASFGVVAGDQAFSLGAWADAASYYDAALRSGAGQTDPDGLYRLEHKAGVASYRNHDIPAAIAHEERAVAVAEAIGDLELWGQAAVVLGKCRIAHGAPAGTVIADLAPLERFLDACGDRLPALRAEVLAEMAEAHYVAFDFETGLQLADRARSLIGSETADAARCSMEFAAGLQYMAVLDLDQAEVSFERSAAHALRTTDRWMQAWGVVRLPLVHWARGDLARAEREAEGACALVEANQDYAEYSLVSACLAGVAASRGIFDETEEQAAKAHLMYLRSNYSFSPMIYCLALAYARSYRGDSEGAREAIERWRQAGAGGLSRWSPVIDAISGDRAAVERQLTDRTRLTAGLDAPNLFTVGSGGAAVEIGDAIGDRVLIEAAAEPLNAAGRRGISFALGWPHFIPRLQGVIAYWKGDLDQSVKLLEEAEAVAEALGSPPERARSQLDLARSLLSRQAGGDEARAIQLAVSASKTFNELELSPFAVRARTLISP